MLAQGQSSPAKRGGLAADVSSGMVFLKKKKKKKKEKKKRSQSESWKTEHLASMLVGPLAMFMTTWAIAGYRKREAQ